ALCADGRSESDMGQGVTCEVFGEGWSLGPLNAGMKRERLEQQGDIQYDITWTTLDEALETLVRRGISTNIASFVGATTVRMHEVGNDDRAPNAQELQRMRAHVDRAMRDRAGRGGASPGARDQRGHVSLRGGRNGPECLLPAMVARRWTACAAHTAARSRDAGPHPRRDGATGTRLGEPVRSRRRRRRRAP